MICFDTAPLIWGVQGNPPADRPHLNERVQLYLEWLDEQGIATSIPSLVVAEYLQGFDEEVAEQSRTELEQGFVIWSFDLPTADIAARLFRDRFESVRSQYDTPRQCLKNDFSIVATAMKHGADKLVTDEVEEFRAIARGELEVIEVPKVAKVQKLPI